MLGLELNLKLQGQGNTLCDLMAAVRAFERWLEIFKSDITEAQLHFPTSTFQVNSRWRPVRSVCEELRNYKTYHNTEDD